MTTGPWQGNCGWAGACGMGLFAGAGTLLLPATTWIFHFVRMQYLAARRRGHRRREW